jgi:hypothetical protein
MGAVRLIYDESSRQFRRLGWWGELNLVSVHLGKIPDLNHDGSESETSNDPEAESGTEEVASEEES